MRNVLNSNKIFKTRFPYKLSSHFLHFDKVWTKFYADNEYFDCSEIAKTSEIETFLMPQFKQEMENFCFFVSQMIQNNGNELARNVKAIRDYGKTLLSDEHEALVEEFFNKPTEIMINTRSVSNERSSEQLMQFAAGLGQNIFREMDQEMGFGPSFDMVKGLATKAGEYMVYDAGKLAGDVGEQMKYYAEQLKTVVGGRI